MADRYSLNRLLKERFTGFNGSPDVDIFVDYMQTCIYHDGDLRRDIDNCSKRSLNGYVWKAVLNELNDLFYYMDIPATPATSKQAQDALTAFFGTDYKNVVKPIIDYFIKERETE